MLEAVKETALDIAPAGTADIPLIRALAARIWPSGYAGVLTEA